MAGKSTGRVFRFGPFEADETTGELRKHGTRIKLHAQPFQVLLMLLEKPFELVTREELRQRLWREDTFVDFDHGLNAAVNKLRQALGDSAAHPRHVETIPGKGYRFISPVTLPDAVSDGPDQAGDAVPRVSTFLTTPHELPRAPRKVIRILLLLAQGMYLAFYMSALSNLQEIHSLLVQARLVSPEFLMTLLVITAAAMIPVRLFLAAAVLFHHESLWRKFSILFPVLLIADTAWALSPLLLVNHISAGFALGIVAALLYMPFAQRSLILMYTTR
jgi:DNA-binding winged helix-turn-helix (wHTH) protein